MERKERLAMKLIIKYLKPFAALVLACLILLFGQAACDLTLPGLLSDTVNVGVRQSGLEAGMPEALSVRGMELLKCFLSTADREVMEGLYNEIDPESSESRRFSEKYPLAAQMAICVLREGLTEEERAQGDKVYANAAYGFLLYMQQAGETGELGEIAQKSPAAQSKPKEPGAFRGNLKEPSYGTSSLPEGVLGTIPEGALFRMPGEASEGEAASSAGPEVSGETGSVQTDFEGTSFGENGTSLASGGPEGQASEEGNHAFPDDADSEGQASEEGNTTFLDDPDSEGQASEEGNTTFLDDPDSEGQASEEGNTAFLDDTDSEGLKNLEKIYGMIPVLSQVPESSLRGVMEQAAADDGGVSGQVGIALKKRFYQELGVDTDAIRSGYIRTVGLKMLGVAFLGLAATVLAGLLSARIAAKAGKRLRRDLLDPCGVRTLQTLAVLGVRAAFYAPVLGVGSAILAVKRSVSTVWVVIEAAVVLLGLLLVAVSLAPARFKAPQKLVDRLIPAGPMTPADGQETRADGESPEERRAEAVSRRVWWGAALLTPAVLLLTGLISWLAAGAGESSMAASVLRLGDMLAFIQYAVETVLAFLIIAFLCALLPKAKASAARLRKVPETDGKPEN